MFLEHVAEQAPFALNYAAVSAEVWNQRSHFSSPDRGYLAVHPEELVDVFRTITVERRTVVAPPLSPELQQLADLYATHYAHPPRRRAGAGTDAGIDATPLSDYRPDRGATKPGPQNGYER